MDPAGVLDAYLQANQEHLTVIAHTENKWDVLVPSYWKETVAVSFDLSHLRLRGDLFYMRKPDENADAAYQLLLRRNHRAHCWKFAVNDVGDVYLVCEVPVGGVTHEELDRLFGALITVVDETYVPYMELAFGTALREQISRGGPGLGRPPWAASWDPAGSPEAGPQA
jgi:hypothetical protein